MAHLITFKQADVTALENPLPMPAVEGEAREVGMLDLQPALWRASWRVPGPAGSAPGPGRCPAPQLPGLEGHPFCLPRLSCLSCLRLRADKQYRLFNGALECQLRNYQIALDSVASQKEVAQDFANRLRKNLKTLEKWASKEGIDCYRLYDADLPEYNAAIDRYRDYLVVQEYAAPKDIPAQKTRQRLLDMVQAAIKVTGMDGEKVILKVRERQEGKQQYQKLSEEQHRMEVQEYGARLSGQPLRLPGYRPLPRPPSDPSHAGSDGQRQALPEPVCLYRQCHRARGSWRGERDHHGGHVPHLPQLGAGQHAAQLAGGPSAQVRPGRLPEVALRGRGSVRSHLHRSAHLLQLQADGRDFDVQRDHLLLMQHLKRLLAADGTLVFSNNKRHFKMDLAGLEAAGLKAQNITGKTRPKDFERNQHIHNCWIITHAETQA